MASVLRCANASPAGARFFVQLAKRSAAASSSTSAPVLDVFAPRLCGPARGRSSYSTASSKTRTTRRDELRGCTILSNPQAPRTLGHRRTFMSSAPQRATACVYNPQKDDDGNDMFLEITDRAGTRLSQIMKKDANPNLALRISVESGGCHGFQYLMSLVTLPPSDLGEKGDGGHAASALAEEDTIFQYAAEADTANSSPTGGAPKIVIDQPSLELLKGSKVDFTMELIGSQFKITDNPYASSACGCGTSFDIKI